MTQPDTIRACPECDSSDTNRRSRAGGYRCDNCKAVFDEPVYRAPKHAARSNTGGLSAHGRAALEWEGEG